MPQSVGCELYVVNPLANIPAHTYTPAMSRDRRILLEIPPALREQVEALRLANPPACGDPDCAAWSARRSRCLRDKCVPGTVEELPTPPSSTVSVSAVPLGE